MQRKISSFHTKKRKPLKKLGAIGRANIVAREKITQTCKERNINYCEIWSKGCLRTWLLSPTYRQKRDWYKGDVEKLADYNEWVVACHNCYIQIENDEALTLKVFKKLRP